MSQTRIVCEKCGFVQVYCECKNKLTNEMVFERSYMIPLSNGGEALVDKEDYSELSVHKWRNHKGYAIRDRKKSDGPGTAKIRMHRAINNTPNGMETDHANGNKLDNRRSNLRSATHRQNITNQKPLAGGTSKYKGVAWNRQRCKWEVSIRINGKQKYLGDFSDEFKAATAYNQAALKYNGEFARLNDV